MIYSLVVTLVHNIHTSEDSFYFYAPEVVVIREIAIENFKPFGTMQTFQLAPLTLIYGPNSSGKSSIIQALMMLRQSLELSGVLGSVLVTRGEYVDLGSFRSLLYKHDIKRQFKISIKYTPSDLTLTRPTDPHTSPHEHLRTVTIGFRAAPSANSKQQDSSDLSYVNYNLSGPNPLNVGLTKTATSVKRIDIGLPSYRRRSIFKWENTKTSRSFASYLDSFYTRTQQTEIARRPTTIKRSVYESYLEASIAMSDEGLPTRVLRSSLRQDQDDALISHRASRALYRIAAEYHKLLSSFFYLGPLRSYPARYYLLMGGQKDTVGARGEYAPQLIYRHRRKIEKQINNWFSRFEIPYRLKVISAGNDITGELIALTLTDRRTNVEVAPSDVGFGVGQLLPIIVEGVVSRNRVICVEQPEIHLHPRLQASIADLLINTAGLNSSSKKEGQNTNQWIIETHSEALMLRIQRRIREGELNPQDVSVIYVEPTKNKGSRILNLRLDEHGEFIDEWPHGFFEESYHEQFTAGK